MKARGLELAAMIAMAILLIPFVLALWFGPALYGALLLTQGHDVLGPAVAAAGLVWVVLIWRDKAAPGLLFGAVGSLLIQAGLMQDPWEDPELKELEERIARGEFT